jgi:hypothetical protein
MLLQQLRLRFRKEHIRRKINDIPLQRQGTGPTRNLRMLGKRTLLSPLLIPMENFLDFYFSKAAVPVELFFYSARSRRAPPHPKPFPPDGPPNPG